ncbi:ribosomal protein S18 acetylase RimI-like enzyme [Spinactinospora alkalitolerans]|uniref:Ribosomal protein S18 acetylase RimI-like enzyme n=1 Tax=Spinactinospora alkalitolerans TaxID=687207 RepID=A0A852U0Z7_9ACTN|nr:ribosomal protein S18 acetylase RimI-like enzyme [Spinactinospora alkalitolerans]
MIDHDTWSWRVAPVPRWPVDAVFFDDEAEVADTLVAEVDGAVAGYVQVSRAMALASAAHVQEVKGLAVAPKAQGRGVGRALLEAARAVAAERGARKLTLRVLAGNLEAMALYRSFGFEVEGVLKEYFLLDGRYVDDVLMALPLTR